MSEHCLATAEGRLVPIAELSDDELRACLTDGVVALDSMAVESIMRELLRERLARRRNRYG